MGDSSFAIGMVLRNDHDKFMMRKNLRMVGQVTVMETKAQGVQDALIWVVELQLQLVVIL